MDRLLSPFRWIGRLFLVSLVALFCLACSAAIPAECYKLRSHLIREARYQWGLDAPTATFAAQLRQESQCRTDAVSRVGARGAGQFMPATAAWMKTLDPSLAFDTPREQQRAPPAEQESRPGSAGAWGVGHPIWDLRALSTYNRWLWDRTTGVNPCERGAKSLRGYNGGLAWVQRDEKLARSKGLNPDVNFGQLDQVNAGRSVANWRENTHYPRVILLKFEPEMVAAGFGRGVCT